MNLRKKMRRGSLAALIALALTSSALAMPTGGIVQSGDVNIGGSTDFSTVANGATITSTTDSAINWNTFNIASDETLNFNIADGKTLVNNVTGSQLSDILGKMNQPGGGGYGGNLVLVNPNGIHVGGNAVLNVANLTLSTLAMTESGNQLSFAKGATNGTINIDGSATFNAVDCVSIFAGKVNVADGVTFNLGDGSMNKTILDIKAMDRADYTMVGEDAKVQNFTHNAGNDVVFNGTVNVKNNQEGEVEIGGATVSSTGAKFLGNQLETTLYAAGKMGIDERAADRNDHRYTAETTAANTLTVDGIEARGSSVDAKGEQLSLGGGVVSVKNSSAKVDKLSIEALSSYKGKGGGFLIETKAAPDRTVNVAGSRFDAAGVRVHGGKVTVDENTKFDGGGLARLVEIVADSVDDRNNRFTTEKGNDLAFHGDIAGYKSTVPFIGNTVNLDHATVNAGRFKVVAGNELVADVSVKATTENTVSAADAVINTTDARLVGGKVAVKDSSFTSDEEVRLVAGNEVDYGKYYTVAAATADNTVRMENVKADVKEVHVVGGKVAVKDSSFTSDGEVALVASNKVDLEKYTGTATADNTVRMENVKADVKEFDVVGGKVDLTGANITAREDVSFLIGNEVNGDNATVTKDNMLTLRRTTINAPVAELSAAGAEAYDGTAVNASKELKQFDVKRTDGSEAVYQRDASSHIRQNGEEASIFKVVNTKPEPKPEPQPQPQPKPEPPKPVPTPELSKDDKANMASGKQAVEEALSKNASQENRIAALTDVVADLNAKASRRQSAGVVVGIVQEVATSAALSDGEKVALVERVLSAYAPVQEAKAEQDNTATNALDEAVDAAANVSVAPVYPDETEAEDVVTFA